MFTACPHCQYLVARDPRSGATPADCPRCGGPLATTAETPASASASAPSLATLLHAAPPAADAAAVEAPATDHETASVDASAAPADTPAPVDPSDAHVEQASAEDLIAAPAADAAQDDTEAAIEFPSPEPAPVPPTKARGALARNTTAPRFLHRARTPPVHARRARLQWIVVAALSLLLCIQVVIADRARLATQSGWRPIVTTLCAVLRCDVPTWREPAAFTMLSRDVRPLPGTPGTLQAQATFRNEARWAQAWPVVLLTLKDADGRTLGARALQPGDYLPEGEAATAIGPGQSAQMAVRIREPSASVVAFSFDFR